ncbi:putative protein phosphatase 2C 5, partial [Bienertia sinuspersici]
MLLALRSRFSVEFCCNGYPQLIGGWRSSSQSLLKIFGNTKVANLFQGKLTDVETYPKMSQTEISRMKSPLLPLETLIGQEIRAENVEKPIFTYGQAALAKKEEDLFLTQIDCQQNPGNPSTSLSVFA